MECIIVWMEVEWTSKDAMEASMIVLLLNCTISATTNSYSQAN